MKVTVITVSFNSEKTILDSVKSVLGQSIKDLEYIIIDGGSTDGTLARIVPYRNRLAHLISEQDNGIYNAMNKGLRLATGEVIAILNSDDFYAAPDVLEAVEDIFRRYPDVGVVYGDLDYVDVRDPSIVVRRWRSGEYHPGRFRLGWHPPHPAFFMRKTIYDKFGLFNEHYRIAADYEMMLRVLEHHSVPAVYLAKTMVKMRTGGASNGSLRGILQANIESFRAWGENGLVPPIWLPLLKPLSKIPQLLFPGRG